MKIDVRRISRIQGLVKKIRELSRLLGGKGLEEAIDLEYKSEKLLTNSGAVIIEF